MDIKDFFAEHREIAIAYSGGVDSAYLLHVATKYAGRVRSYCVKSAFQPDHEHRDAIAIAREIGADMSVIELDITSDAEITSNMPDRCYHCKKKIMSTMIAHASRDGFVELADGTNASDDLADRPGYRAIREMRVLSPLLECGMTKEMIRAESRRAGLSSWNKPSYACLATRIPHGDVITREKLRLIESAEDDMMSLGFSDFRVRLLGRAAKIELTDDDLARAFEMRRQICNMLGQRFESVMLDMKPRRSGG